MAEQEGDYRHILSLFLFTDFTDFTDLKKPYFQHSYIRFHEISLLSSPQSTICQLLTQG